MPSDYSAAPAGTGAEATSSVVSTADNTSQQEQQPTTHMHPPVSESLVRTAPTSTSPAPVSFPAPARGNFAIALAAALSNIRNNNTAVDSSRQERTQQQQQASSASSSVAAAAPGGTALAPGTSVASTFLHASRNFAAATMAASASTTSEQAKSQGTSQTATTITSPETDGTTTATVTASTDAAENNLNSGTIHGTTTTATGSINAAAATIPTEISSGVSGTSQKEQHTGNFL